MNVPNVLSGLTNLTSQATTSTSSAVAAAAVGKAAAVAQSVAPTATAAMREILSKYDMTDITPNDFSKLIQQMSQKGAISPKDRARVVVDPRRPGKRRRQLRRVGEPLGVLSEADRQGPSRCRSVAQFRGGQSER